MATTLTWKKTALDVAAGGRTWCGAGSSRTKSEHLRGNAGGVVHHVSVHAGAECRFMQALAARTRN
jgi:hypothetical protein